MAELEAEQTQPVVIAAPIPRPVVRSLVGLAASQLALTLAAMWFAYIANAQSDQQWCGTLVVFLQAYDQNPPTTQAGRDIETQMRRLYAEFGCAKVKRI